MDDENGNRYSGAGNADVGVAFPVVG